jgi:hypothetical protein
LYLVRDIADVPGRNRARRDRELQKLLGRATANLDSFNPLDDSAGASRIALDRQLPKVVAAYGEGRAHV